MCGIAGIVDYRGAGVDDDDVRAMTQTMAHRGPDDVGYHHDRRVALGMRRLSIIDVACGQQPMTNEDGSVVVVCNGEIYNYRALRDELRARGHTLTTSSDTEVIAHVYEDDGLDLVDRLEGMFGFAVWDASARRLIVARDRLGIKPLYYVDDGTRLLFASEIKALLAHPDVDASIDHEALALYLALKYVPAPMTLFRGIRSLPPGCMLVVDDAGVRVRRYWTLPMTEPTRRRSDDEYVDEFRELLGATVSAHMQSDVPFGCFLSGGLDSSLMTALMSERSTQPIKTFSVGFATSDATRDELSYARTVARAFATDHHEIVMTGDDFVANAERVVWHLDQPIGDAPAVATMLLADLASQQVKMVLSGEGGDELFAGYARYSAERVAPALGVLPRPVRRALLRSAKAATRDRRRRLALHALATPDFLDRLVNWFPLFDDEMRAELMSPQLRDAAAGGPTPQAVFGEALQRTASTTALNQMLSCDTQLWLPDLLLLRGDKMSMAASIELRVPLLDHKIVEFAGRLPMSLKLHGLQRKVLLRRIGEGLLPAEILERPKEGFSLPVSQWLRREARDLLEDCLAPDVVRRRGLFDPGYVSRLVARHHAGHDHGTQLWALVGLELWMQRFIDRRNGRAPADGPASDVAGCGSRASDERHTQRAAAHGTDR